MFHNIDAAHRIDPGSLVARGVPMAGTETENKQFYHGLLCSEGV